MIDTKYLVSIKVALVVLTAIPNRYTNPSAVGWGAAASTFYGKNAM
jgi:hypothetical protein